tara:strand:- start:6131 stop:6457 length:327 start_codon:yes stop_codon:yes gene_type:complete
MAIYNLTAIQNTGNMSIVRLFFETNVISNQWLAYGLLILIFAVTVTAIKRYGNNIYAALIAGSFITSLVALMFRLTQYDGDGMISTTIVILCFTVTGIFAAWKVAAKK